MKRYSILYAKDVPHYASYEIEADNDEAAIELASKFDWSHLSSDPDHHSSTCRRIVSIDLDDKTVEEDIALDEWFLCEGLKKRQLYDCAPELLKALRIIAAIPLQGDSPEALDDLKPQMANLQRAVEVARVVVAKTEGDAP